MNVVRGQLVTRGDERILKLLSWGSGAPRVSQDGCWQGLKREEGAFGVPVPPRTAPCSPPPPCTGAKHVPVSTELSSAWASS